MDIIRTEIDAKFQVKHCCCCVGLKTGTTIVAAINLISLLVFMILPFTGSDDEHPELDEETNAYLEVLHAKTSAARIARTLYALILMLIVGSMLYGNIKGDKKLMLPYVYLVLINLGGILVLEFIGCLTLLFMGAFGAAFLLFFLLTLIFAFPLYFWEVVRCRVLELDRMEQPRSGYTQQDPELPAYNDIHGPPAPAAPAMDLATQEKSALAYSNNQVNYE